MRNLILVLIVLSALNFVVAAITALVGSGFLGVASEGFSNACTNLALLAIALLLASKRKDSSS